VATHGRGTSHLRCAAILALAKREKAAASETLSLLVDDADADVRHYAVMGLAAVGDGRAWDAVIARLTAMLGRTRTTEYGDDITPVVTSVIYLLRHAGRDEARAAAVVSLLRLRWPRLTD
jgi:HEAT repeat protein